MTPKELALAAAKALDSKKANDLMVLETGHLTTLADYLSSVPPHPPPRSRLSATTAKRR